MKIHSIYFLMILSIGLSAQPFTRVRTLLPEDTYKICMQVLDSCETKDYYKDSVLYYKGLVNLRKENIKTAWKDCDELMKSYPAFEEAHYLRGLIYFIEKDYAKSVEELNLVLKNNPAHMKALFNRSTALGLLEDYPKAIEDLNTCITLNKSYGQAYYSRAYWYEFSENYEEAIKDYEESIRLDPKYYDAYYGLAYIYVKQKDIGKACDVAKRAVAAGSQVGEEMKDNFCR